MSQIIKAKGSITSAGDVTMPTTVANADIYVSGLTGGSLLIQSADPAGTYVTEQDNGTLTADGRYTWATAVPAQIRVLGSSATGPAIVSIVGR